VIGLEHVRSGDADLVLLTLRDGSELTIAISNDPKADRQHKVVENEREWLWQGFVDVLHRGAES